MLDDGGIAEKRSTAGLIEAVAKRQDKLAFKRLFEFYAPRIKSLMMRRRIVAEVAEDIAQEALAAVWHKAASYDPARATVSAWVYTIARNIHIDRVRREQRAKSHLLYERPESEAPERTDEPLDIVERENRVRTEIDRLPKEQLRVVELSFFEGLAHGDIAIQLGIPLGTVKSRLRLAMARLRECLGDLI